MKLIEHKYASNNLTKLSLISQYTYTQYIPQSRKLCIQYCGSTSHKSRRINSNYNDSCNMSTIKSYKSKFYFTTVIAYLTYLGGQTLHHGKQLRLYLTSPKLSIPQEVSGHDFSLAFITKTLHHAIQPSHDILLSHGLPHSNKSRSPSSLSFSASSNLP